MLRETAQAATTEKPMVPIMRMTKEISQRVRPWRISPYCCSVRFHLEQHIVPEHLLDDAGIETNTLKHLLVLVRGALVCDLLTHLVDVTGERCHRAEDQVQLDLGPIRIGVLHHRLDLRVRVADDLKLLAVLEFHFLRRQSSTFPYQCSA